MSYAKLFKRYTVLNFKELLQFKTAFFLGIFSQLLSFGLNFLFWGVIYSFTNNINGWTLGQILMLQGFFQLYLVFYWFLFHFSECIDELILYGDLDKFLSKPINPLIAHMLRHMSWFSLSRVLSSALYFWISLQLGTSIAAINFIGAVIMVFLGACIMTLILTTIGLSAFWVGKTESLSTVFDTMWEISGYPLTIFPVAAQFALTLGIPVIFLQTYPTLFTLQQISPLYFAQLVLLEIALIAVWMGITTLVWRKGLKRYSSYGG